MSTPVKHTQIVKVSGNLKEEKLDLLATEEPMEIRLTHGPEGDRQEMQLAVTMRTPGHDLELALGFLFSESLINSYDDVVNIRHCETVEKEEERDNVVKVELSPLVKFDAKRLERNFYTTSSCGVCGKTSIDSVEVSCQFNINEDEFEVSREVIRSLPEILRAEQSVFEHTGGIHASALFDIEGKLRIVREDVGRHNALDKVVGASLFEGKVPLRSTLLLVSGRASFELVQKASRAGIPVMAAVGAPSSLAVELAKNSGMTLVGFLRGDRFNVYCGNRI